MSGERKTSSPGFVLPSLQSQPVVGISGPTAATATVSTTTHNEVISSPVNAVSSTDSQMSRSGSADKHLIDLLGKYDTGPKTGDAESGKKPTNLSSKKVEHRVVDDAALPEPKEPETAAENPIAQLKPDRIPVVATKARSPTPVLTQLPPEEIETKTYAGEGAVLDEGSSESEDEEGEDEEEDDEAKPEPIKAANPESSEANAAKSEPEAAAEKISLEGEAFPVMQPTKTEPAVVTTAVTTTAAAMTMTVSDSTEDTKAALTAETISLGADSEPDDLPDEDIKLNMDAATKVEGAPSTSVETTALQRTPTLNSLKVGNPPENNPQAAFDFQKFLEEFKSPECEPIHRYLKSFLAQFSHRNWTVDEQVKLIKDFEQFLLKKMSEYFPFNTMQSEEDIQQCEEGLEKLIMTRLYSQVFSPIVPPNKLSDQHKQDRNLDRKYARNVRLYDWVTLRNLDVPMDLDLHSKLIQLAAKELDKINNYKSPRDKVICILNCCKIIFGLIRQQQKQQNIEENADSFVPFLICVILQAKTKCLHSNLRYIERYRNEEFLVGETSYYVSTMQIACNFVTDLSREQLTVTDEEYEKNMNESEERLKEEIQRREQKRKQASPGPLPKSITDFIQQRSGGESPSEVLTKSANLMKQSLSNKINTLFGDDETEAEAEAEAEAGAEAEAEAEATGGHRHRRYKDLVATEEQLEQIKQLSIKEAKNEEASRKQQEESFNTLASMFPDMDKEVIQDVLATTVNEDGSNIGECVDALLALNS